eukprot:scaffold17459_cov54-Attheya_sp.AAC.4
MASRFYETKEITIPFLQRKKPTNVELGLLVYQGEQHEEYQYAPSCLKKVMRMLASPERSQFLDGVANSRSKIVKDLAAPYDSQVKLKWGAILQTKLLLSFDKKKPEYRILACKEECFRALLQRSNTIANSRALFKYSEWFDKFLALVYPNHCLLGNKVWMHMSNSREARNLIFVARCLAVAVNTDRIQQITSSQNFNDALNAIEAWTKAKIEKKTSLSKSKITASRSTIQLTDPRGFALSLNHDFIDRMSKFSKLGIGYFEIQDEGYEVPDKITSMKLPGRIKKASNNLVNVEVGFENVPDGNEEYTSEDADDNGSGDNDHKSDHGVVHSPVVRKTPVKDKQPVYIAGFHEDTSNSDSDFNARKLEI